MTRTMPSGRVVDLSSASMYDGETGDWMIHSRGYMRGCHPVDQRVAMSFSMKKGDCSSSPDVGNELHRIEYLSAGDLESQIDMMVRDAYPFSLLLASGDVTLISTPYEVRESGDGLAVIINYKNERLGTDEKARWYSK